MSIKKTLFVAPFKDVSGYARAARNYARALTSCNYSDNLVLRSVRYDSGNPKPLDTSLKSLHDKQVDESIEVVIQMLTPNEMRAVEGKKNIAICCWETDRIPQHWVDSLNKFDLIIVPCDANKEAFQNSGVIKPITKVPFAFFNEDYTPDKVGSRGKKFNIPGVDEETTIYYNISQWSHKKGIDALIKGYSLAFQNNENVILVLKGYIGMHNQQGDGQKLLNEINTIRNAMRLPNYPRIYITDQMLTDEDVLRLHASCHCYVNTSRGEGWGVPAYEAILMMNDLVSVNHTGMAEYVTKDNSYIIESFKEPVFNMPHPDKSLYTALENWYEPYTHSTIKALRESYNTLKRKNTKKSVDDALNITNPITIGNLLKDIINA